MSGAGNKRKAPAHSAKGTKGPALKRRKPKGMPDFKPGEILVDLMKKQWRLGELIGWGGFGALYYASPDTAKNVDNKATYVAKVEPHSNGPLFGELAFYQRVAKEDSLKAWMSKRKMKSLGVPQYIGSGSYQKGDKKYRFMIMERFGDDVEQLFLQCSKTFHIQTVLLLALRIINTLEYIHENGYVHADIKGSNLMMGYVTSKKSQVFLVDYGLAYRFNPDGVHKEYKEDPKRKHDGTIEFTSRDAHKGVAPSRRTDLEILGYVMLQWLCGKLPWEDKLADKEYVMESKIKYMTNIPQLLKECLKGQKSDELEEYFKYIVKLGYDEKPDYNKLRKIFQDGLRKRRLSDDDQGVIFKSGEDSMKLSNGHSEDDDEEDRKSTSDKEDADHSPSPIKARRGKPRARKDESRAESVKKSPVKEKSSRKTVTKAAQETSKVTSPPKEAPSKRTRKQPTRKRPIENDEAPPVKKTRGRARKPVMVDTATSP